MVYLAIFPLKVDEMRVKGQEPVMPFQQFWSVAAERLLLLAENNECNHDKLQFPSGKRMHFRNQQDFRQACLFLHENGSIWFSNAGEITGLPFFSSFGRCDLLF